jgi:hypothetical protein
MKTSVKRVKREMAVLAINEATTYFKLNPRTKLGYFCNQFVDLNKAFSKKHNKDQKKLTSQLTLELNKFRVLNALEKDGKLVLTDKNDYSYDRNGEIAVLEKQNEISEKTEEILEPFFDQEVEIVCIVDPFKLPDGIDAMTEKNLNGFVFQNKNEFEEPVEVVE